MILAIIFAVAISLKNHRFHNLILTHLTWVFIRYFCILKEVVESLSGRPVTLTKVAFQVFICSESRNALLWFCHFPRKRLLPRWLPLYWWWRLRSSVSPMKWWARPRWLSAMRVGWVGWPQCHRPPRKYWPSYPAVFNGYGYSTLHCKTLSRSISRSSEFFISAVDIEFNFPVLYYRLQKLQKLTTVMKRCSAKKFPVFWPEKSQKILRNAVHFLFLI